MSQARILVVVAIAVLAGLLASVLVYKRIKPVASSAPSGYLVVAAARLPLGTPLQARDLRRIAWVAGSSRPDGSFSRVEDCVNRVLTTSVIENEPILEGKLAPKDAKGGLPATIPEGMRALSIAVNDVVAVAGFVVPGTMVDVLSTGSVGGAGGNSVTRTLLEDVRVLAAGQKIEQDKDGKPQTVPVITLLVTPQQADTLTMASTEGRIQLALRNTIDTKQTSPPPVFSASIFGGEAETRPVRSGGRSRPEGPAPKQTYVVTIIRGGKAETVTF